MNSVTLVMVRIYYSLHMCTHTHYYLIVCYYYYYYYYYLLSETALKY